MTEEPADRGSQYREEYDEALRAFETIKAQAETLLLMGSADELRQFIDRFIDMASKTAARAHEDGLAPFADSFLDLVQRAENFRNSVVGS